MTIRHALLRLLAAALVFVLVAAFVPYGVPILIAVGVVAVFARWHDTFHS